MFETFKYQFSALLRWVKKQNRSLFAIIYYLLSLIYIKSPRR